MYVLIHSWGVGKLSLSSLMYIREIWGRKHLLTSKFVSLLCCTMLMGSAIPWEGGGLLLQSNLTRDISGGNKWNGLELIYSTCCQNSHNLPKMVCGYANLDLPCRVMRNTRLYPESPKIWQGNTNVVTRGLVLLKIVYRANFFSYHIYTNNIHTHKYSIIPLSFRVILLYSFIVQPRFDTPLPSQSSRIPIFLSLVPPFKQRRNF